METSKLFILQWNCRSLHGKRNSLTHYLNTLPHKPEIILLQETLRDIKLPGYTHYTQTDTPSDTPPSPLVTTYISNDLTSTQIDSSHLNTKDREHVITTLQPYTQANRPITIINSYWKPNKPHPSPQSWLNKLISEHKGHDFILAGDFNAHNHTWGYHKTTSTGRKLETAITNTHFHILNDTNLHTRTGNSVERDTNPDLTLHHGTYHTEWEVLEEQLGSDHKLILTTISLPNKTRTRRKPTLITNWKAFRAEPETPADTLEPTEWLDLLYVNYNKHTTRIHTTIERPHADTHLLNLWNRRHRLIQRWKRKKTNHNLKKRIQQITTEAQQYADKLTADNWNQLCDSLNGQMGTKRAWSILKSMINPPTPRNHLIKIKLSTRLTSGELEAQLKSTFFPDNSPQQATPITPDFAANDIDEPFTLEELRRAINSIKKNTTPGVDQIPYKLLKNLTTDQQIQLLAFYNQIWLTGQIPDKWKHASIQMIPKPGKPPSISNLRPISLTSCAGKLMEKMVLARLEWLLEHKNALHYTQTGFRHSVSTQDTLLRIYHDTLSFPSTAQLRTILGLDIHKAFDNVQHAPILTNLHSLNCGEKMYKYITNFLTERTASFQIPGHSPTPFFLQRGVPQGSILSPTLFNIAMMNLPPY